MAETPPSTAVQQPDTCPTQLTVSTNRLAIVLAQSPPFTFLFVYLAVIVLETIHGGELVHGWDFVIMLLLAISFMFARSIVRGRWNARMAVASERAQAHVYMFQGEPTVVVHNCQKGRNVQLGVAIKTSQKGDTVLIDLANTHWRTDGETRTVRFTEAVYQITRPGATADLFPGDKVTITVPQLPGIVQLLIAGIGQFEPPAASAP